MCFVVTVINSPRLGSPTQTYAQIIIEENDDAHGILDLSTDIVYVPELLPGIVCKVERSRGLFGTVSGLVNS